MSDSIFTDLVNQGAVAHQANRYQEALAAYEKALEIAPTDAEVNSLYGLLLTHLGRLDEAGAFLEKAVEQEPEEIGFRLNLVEYLEKSRQFERAEFEVDIVVSIDAKFARSWEKKGDVSLLRKQLNAAANAYATASALEPDNARVVLKLARVHASLGNINEAHDALDVAEGLEPQRTEMFDLRCAVLTGERNWAGLEVASNLWTANEPESPAAWHRLAQATFEQGRYRQSVAAYDKVLQSGPVNAMKLAAYGRICLHALEFEKAEAALDEAERLDSQLTDMLAAKGLLLTYFGRFGEAEEYCRRCLAVDPDYAPVYTQLVRLTSGRLAKSEMNTLSRLTEDDNKPMENRVIAGFALAHGYDFSGNIDAAFAAYDRANTLRRDHVRAEGLVYDGAQIEARTKRLISLFP